MLSALQVSFTYFIFLEIYIQVKSFSSTKTKCCLKTTLSKNLTNTNKIMTVIHEMKPRKNPRGMSYNAWHNIASFLANPQDLTNLGQVASVLREISKNEHLWENLGYQTLGLKYRRLPYKDVTLYQNGKMLWRKEVNQPDDDLDLQENDVKVWHVGWKEDDTAGLHGHMLRLQLFINHPLQNDNRFGRSIVDYNSVSDPHCAFDISFKADRSKNWRDSSQFERQLSLEKNHRSRGTSPVWSVPAVELMRTNDFTMIMKFKIDDPRQRNIIFGQWAYLWYFMVTVESNQSVGVHLRRNLYTKQALASRRYNVGSEGAQDMKFGTVITSEEEAEQRDRKIAIKADS